MELKVSIFNSGILIFTVIFFCNSSLNNSSVGRSGEGEGGGGKACGPVSMVYLAPNT